jgi:protease-4
MGRLRILLLALLAASAAIAQTSFPSYYSGSDLSFASPGALRYGLYGFDNPALLSTMRAPDLTMTWSTRDDGKPARWGLFAAFPHLGFGVIRTSELYNGYTVAPAGGAYAPVDAPDVTYDYQLTSSFGDRTFSGGFGYGWSSGDRRGMHEQNWARFGFLFRPVRYLSVGVTGTQALGGSSKEGVVELAVRPFGTEVLTLFGDASFTSDVTPSDGFWSAGAVVEPLPGIRLTGRYLPETAFGTLNPSSFTVGLELGLGHLGFAAGANLDDRGRSDDGRYNIYSVRLGAYDRTVTNRLGDRRYAELPLTGPLKYRRFMLFDDSRTLTDVLEQIEIARRDDAVSGLVVNLSGLSAGRNMLWEVREKLAEFRRSGKTVVVYVDRVGMDEYHIASVADRIVMDPLGMMSLEGYLLGRTFLKGTLEKVGIGFREVRLFTYKSANEALSRDSMSAADREQRQRLVEEYYDVARAEICAARRLTPERFDELVNGRVAYTPGQALALGLVDSLGRWDDRKAYLRTVEGRKISTTSVSSLAEGKLPYDDRWGQPPTIALIYALGVCDMEEGISARSLARVVADAVSDDDVRAIVLRVDSPGGDALASDYVAQALKKAKGKKPVIVSQGGVAASGGYWLSMYADTIVAAPTTITGSIGVAAGWLYNTELKQKLGMSTDHVKVGRHADVGFGFQMPLLGLGVPDRDLSPEEQEQIEGTIRQLYGDFVARVAAGRELDTAAIEAVAQGRVWSGRDGLAKGLVDVLGGMETAIRIARERAGIAADEEIILREAPAPGLLNLSAFMPGILGTGTAAEPDPALRHLLFRLKNNGVPMPIMPLEESGAAFE